MFLEDGTDLDDYVTTAGSWRPGDTLYAGGLPAYRITNVPLSDIDEYQAIWTVAPLIDEDGLPSRLREESWGNCGVPATPGCGGRRGRPSQPFLFGAIEL